MLQRRASKAATKLKSHMAEVTAIRTLNDMNCVYQAKCTSDITKTLRVWRVTCAGFVLTFPAWPGCRSSWQRPRRNSPATMLCAVNQAGYLLKRQLESQGRTFLSSG